MKQNQNNRLVHIILLVSVLTFAVIGIGYFAYKNGQVQVTSSNLPLNSPTPTTLRIDTSNWKTYTDKLNRFTFEYPDDVQIVTNNESVVLVFPELYRNISIKIHPATNEPLKDYLTNKYLPNSDGNLTQLEPTVIQVSTYTGLRAIAMIVDYGTPEYIVFKSENSKYVVDIEHFAFDDDPSIYIPGYEPKQTISEEKVVFYKILSTFKFIE